MEAISKTFVEEVKKYLELGVEISEKSRRTVGI